MEKDRHAEIDMLSNSAFLSFFLVSPNETTRGHVSKYARSSRVDVRKYFFGNSVVKICNSLPATVEDFASIRKFKSFIDVLICLSM